MKIPQNMYNLHKADKELATNDHTLQSKAEKIEKEQASLERADKRVSSKVTTLDKDVKELKTTVSEMKESMKAQIKDQQVTIQQMSESTVKLTLQDKLVFNKRSVHITRDGRRLLNNFAKSVQNSGYPVHIRIVGHTDNLPISKFQRTEFLDNWELSADRAAAVARYLIWAGKLDPTSMHVEGRADSQPVVPNTSEKNRAQNRRVELYMEHAKNDVNMPPVMSNNPCSVAVNPCASNNPCGMTTNPCADKEPEVTPIM
ncbi:MAG: OmpA family protein [Mariprofundaceae bacterium]|nr:OmpA family protein [Mariprofundaceae bacterium]